MTDGPSTDGTDHLGMSDRTCICDGGLAILDHIPIAESPQAKTVDTFECVDCGGRGVIHFVEFSAPRKFGSVFGRSTTDTDHSEGKP